MRLLRNKVWSWLDVALLKWSCLLLGMVMGAYLADVVRSYWWVLLLLAIVFAIRPALTYFRD